MEAFLIAGAVMFIVFVVIYLTLMSVYHLLMDISERIDAIWSDLVDDEFGDLS